MAECGGSFAGGDTYAGTENAERITEELSIANAAIYIFRHISMKGFCCYVAARVFGATDEYLSSQKVDIGEQPQGASSG